MPAMKLRSRKNGIVGRLDPASLYTTEGCLRYAGLGRMSLAQARREGVPAIQVGHRHYYRGRDLIAWLERRGSEEAKGRATGSCTQEAAGG